MRNFLGLCGLVLLAGCSTGPGDSALCGVPESVESGAGMATVDGTESAGLGALWQDLGGPGVLIDLTDGGGLTITLSMQTVADGRAIGEAMLGGAPFEAELGARADEGADMSVTVNGGSSNSSNGAGGRLLITAYDGNEMAGCFAAETDIVTVTQAAFRALPR